MRTWFCTDGGLQLPPWLNEGLAEFFSTLRITDTHCELGAPQAMRLETLRHHPWLPFAELLAVDHESFARKTRDQMAIFYAESWALTHMLVSSPEYAPHFRELVAALNSGSSEPPCAYDHLRKTSGVDREGFAGMVPAA